MRPFSLILVLNDSFTFMNAEMSNKQFMKCTDLKETDAYASERSEIKQVISSDSYTTYSFLSLENEVPISHDLGWGGFGLYNGALSTA
jgi:hypothetical protein